MLMIFFFTAAEFNILLDPEAASIVFSTGLVVMVPLEVTHTALVNEAVLEEIQKMDSKYTTYLRDLLLFFADSYRDVFGFKHPVRLLLLVWE